MKKSILFSVLISFLLIPATEASGPGGDTLSQEIQAFRVWAVQRVPELAALQGKINTAIIPVDRKGDWWQKRHARKLREIKKRKKAVILSIEGGGG